MIDPQLQQVLEKHAPHFSLTPEGKVKCELNGHCFPPRAEAVAAFANGPKFAKLLQQHNDEQYLKTLDPFLIPSKNFPGRLFCALTCQVLNATSKAAKTHINGKRFKRAKERYIADKQELLEEPELIESEEGEEAAPITPETADGSAASDPAGECGGQVREERGGQSSEEGGGEDGPEFWAMQDTVMGEDGDVAEPLSGSSKRAAAAGGIAAMDSDSNGLQRPNGTSNGSATARSKKKKVQPKAKRARLAA